MTFTARPAAKLRRLVADAIAAGRLEQGPLGRLASGWAVDVAGAHYRRMFGNVLKLKPQVQLEQTDVRAGRLLLVCGSLGAGGTERQVVTTIRGLAARGWSDIALSCVFLDPPLDFYCSYLDGLGVDVSRLPRFDALALQPDPVTDRVRNALPGELHDIARYVAVMRALKPEIVHAWLDETNVKAGIAAVLAGIPRIVLSCRSVAPTNFALFQPYMKEGYLALLRQPQVTILNNSHAGAADYAEWLECEGKRFRVVRNGFEGAAAQQVDALDARRRISQRLGISPDVPLVGGVLRLSEEKQPLLWIDMAARVAQLRPDCCFVVVGDGQLRETVESRVRHAHLQDRVHLVGQQHDTLQWMAAFDVLVLTSRLEGLPNVLIEAQALGTPVVTTPAAGAAEAVQHGVTGLVAERATAASVADAVVQVLDDVPWRTRAGTAGPAFVAEQFGAERMITETLDVYRLAGTALANGRMNG